MAPEPVHQALYRRWRAQTFAQVVGQEAVVETLRNAVRTNRVAHAILFVGPRGTGKTSLARILATAAFSRMAHFARTVCTQYSVNCWARPHRNASREFFTLEHPAQHVE